MLLYRHESCKNNVTEVNIARDYREIAVYRAGIIFCLYSEMPARLLGGVKILSIK